MSSATVNRERINSCPYAEGVTPISPGLMRSSYPGLRSQHRTFNAEGVAACDTGVELLQRSKSFH